MVEVAGSSADGCSCFKATTHVPDGAHAAGELRLAGSTRRPPKLDRPEIPNFFEPLSSTRAPQTDTILHVPATMDSEAAHVPAPQTSTETARSNMASESAPEDGSRRVPPAGEKRKRHPNDGHHGRGGRGQGSKYKRDWKTGSNSQRRKDYK